jgi:hypothetical protein
MPGWLAIIASGGLGQQHLLIILFCFDVCRGWFGFAGPGPPTIDSNVVAGSPELIDDQRVSHQNALNRLGRARSQERCGKDKKRSGV